MQDGAEESVTGVGEGDEVVGYAGCKKGLFWHLWRRLGRQPGGYQCDGGSGALRGCDRVYGRQGLRSGGRSDDAEESKQYRSLHCTTVERAIKITKKR